MEDGTFDAFDLSTAFLVSTLGVEATGGQVTGRFMTFP